MLQGVTTPGFPGVVTPSPRRTLFIIYLGHGALLGPRAGLDSYSELVLGLVTVPRGTVTRARARVTSRTL